MLLYLTPVHDRGHGRRITAVLQRHKEEEEAEARSRLAGVYPAVSSTALMETRGIQKKTGLPESRILDSLSTTDLTETRF